MSKQKNRSKQKKKKKEKKRRTCCLRRLQQRYKDRGNVALPRCSQILGPERLLRTLAQLTYSPRFACDDANPTRLCVRCRRDCAEATVESWRGAEAAEDDHAADSGCQRCRRAFFFFGGDRLSGGSLCHRQRAARRLRSLQSSRRPERQQGAGGRQSTAHDDEQPRRAPGGGHCGSGTFLQQ